MKKQLALLLGIVSLISIMPALADDVNVGVTVSGYMTATFGTYTAVDYGSLAAGTSNEPAPNQADGIYNVTVSTNNPWKVSASGTAFDDGGGHTFAIGNLTMDTNSTAGNLASGSAVTLTGSPQIIDTGYSAGDNQDNFNGFWLSIPASQYAAAYSSNITITYANV
jgi:hypothetical protein